MKKAIFVILCIMLGTIFINYINQEPTYRIYKEGDNVEQISVLLNDISTATNTSGVKVVVNQEQVSEDMLSCYVSDRLVVMMPITMLRDYLDCRIRMYADDSILVERGITRVILQMDSNVAEVNSSTITMRETVREESGIVYVPVEDIASYLHVDCSYSVLDNTLTMNQLVYEEVLPEQYDMRAEGMVSPVRDQGIFGTCWAFAALAALETTLLPAEPFIYSVDHMSMLSGFNIENLNGGDYTMTLAYLASWKGPVLESDDPYGDSETNENAKEVKHLEEAVFVNSKDYEAIKRYVYKYGGVQSSIYMELELQDGKSESGFYNAKESAYYYTGENACNHDVVIVGWDDNYPKEKFAKQPEADGAFICKNSWGTGFGDAGYIYISYYDSKIGTTNVAYTKLENTDNFDHNYQSDLLGWVGQLGFDSSNAYFANVFETKGKEELAAVSFYATDANTSYKVYVVPEYQNKASMDKRFMVAEGSFDHGGYYTVRLDDPVALNNAGKFAVVVYINTPGSERPVAIEYAADARTSTANIRDGEGYISLYGESWTRVEDSQSANVCLKAFTNDME